MQSLQSYKLSARPLKGGIGALFDPRVNTIGWRALATILPVTYGGELLYLQRDLCTLSLPRDSARDNQYACMTSDHTAKAT